MHSNRSIPTLKSKNGIQLTGQLIQAELMDPRSPLFQDLNNAINNAILAKHVHEKKADEYINAKTLERKIEELEKELAQERKSSYEKYIKAFEAYYKELELAIKNAQISANANNTHNINNQTSHYYTLLHSLAIFAQALTVVQNELVELQNERESLLQSYAENQQACGEAFDEVLSNPATPYIVGENTYYLNINKIPLEKQEEVKEEIQHARNVLTNPKTQEERIKAFPLNHPARVNFEKNGVTDKELIHIAMLREMVMARMSKSFLIASKQIKTDSDTPVTRQATLFAQKVGNQFSRFQKKATKIDGKLYQTSKKNDFLLAEEALLEAHLSNIVEDLANHPFTKADPKRANASHHLRQVVNINNVDLRPNPMAGG